MILAVGSPIREATHPFASSCRITAYRSGTAIRTKVSESLIKRLINPTPPEQMAILSTLPSYRKRNIVPHLFPGNNIKRSGQKQTISGIGRPVTYRNHPVRRGPSLPARASNARSSCGPRRCGQSPPSPGRPSSGRQARTSGRSLCKRPRSQS